MEFRLFLISLEQIALITNFDDRVNDLLKVITILDPNDIIPFINLSHREWPSVYLKTQELSPGLNTDIGQLRPSPTIREIYDLVCKTLVIVTSERLIWLASLSERVDPHASDWIKNLVMDNHTIRLSSATILEALSRSNRTKGVNKDNLWHAYAVCHDLGRVAHRVLIENPKKPSKIIPVCGIPIIREHIPTLSTIAAWEKLGPCIMEPKRDGYYCQIHKKGQKVYLYSVNGENWATKYSDRFSEVITSILHEIQLDEVILEAELIAWDNEREFLPRTKFWEATNYKLLIYDLLFASGYDWTIKPYNKRRKELIRIIRPEKDECIIIPKEYYVNSLSELEQAFTHEDPQFEGVIAKSPTFILRPGQKSLGRVKVKKHENIDVTLVGLGFGRNPDGSKYPNQYLLAIYDPINDRFLTIGYASEGLGKEDSKKLISQIQGLLTESKPLRVIILTDQVPDSWVVPKIVLEVKFEKIEFTAQSKEPNAPFRVIGIQFAKDCLRTKDKTPEDSTTIDDLGDYATLNQS